ncbi:MAG: alkaline phosphatase family protein [Acidobacteriota bacterium]|nr:alkaline phosphatase family protein [Acidobacteriota bacterium]
MKRISVLALLAACLLNAQKQPPAKPKLILAVAIDQFRYDYLLRFGADYKAGFRRILDRGAVFDNAHYQHFLTVTAVGHSTFLSGATPSMSGIVGNDWFDRETKKSVTSVSDAATKLVGAAPGAIGSSPHNLLVSTVGDEIKMQDPRNKVIGVSIKDRSAILPAGHMADGAYWFDAKANRWVTSTYFMQALPKWVEAINDSKPAARAEGAKWYPLDAPGQGSPLCTMVKGAKDRYCGSLEATPWGNELIEEFAEKALVSENMGHHENTDVLAVSFSSNDYVGHAVGPDDPAVRDISRRTDLLLGKLLDFVDRQVGAENVLFVMTADHGVAPVPEVNVARHMPGGRLTAAPLDAAIEEALTKKFGPGKWIQGTSSSNDWFDYSLAARYNASLADVENTAAEAVRNLPHVFRVYTGEQVRTGQFAGDYVGTMVRNGYYRQRSPDLIVIPDDYYMFDASGTTHGTPFKYDTHVPVVFMGAGIRAGHYYEEVTVNDIAPTLAAIARVQEPSGSIGHVLQEIWQ